jgi:hypothetical protein
VEALQEVLCDDRGAPIHSTDADVFPPHTDGVALESPYDFLMLFCERRDPVGGLSICIPLDEVVDKLSLHERRYLMQPIYVFPSGPRPIITRAGDQRRIRYNRGEIESIDAPLAAQQEATEILDRLDVTLEELGKEHRFLLAERHCLIAHNHRVLHGRTAFARSSNRLLKRLRGYWHPPAPVPVGDGAKDG